MSEDAIKPFRWNVDKNRQLQAERGVSFEQALNAIQNSQLLDIIQPQLRQVSSPANFYP